MKFQFPKGFLWGAATSAHQVEGGNHNDWSEWEKETLKEHLAGAEKRNWPVYILDKHPNPLEPENYISGRACDHYNRFREDFDIAKNLGHNAHRFSLEWSRIEPSEGKFAEKELAHYQEVVNALRERGLEPIATIWHWTNPLWVQSKGGWENPEVVGDFIRYVEKVISTVRGVRFWMPLNEPGIYAGLGYIQGVQPPGVQSLSKANRVVKNLMRAFREASDVIHRHQADAQVGISHYAVALIPYKNFAWNRLLALFLHYIRNTRFLNAVYRESDFIGIQYYHTDFVNFKMGGRFGFLELKNPNEWTSDLNWQIYPEGLLRVLQWAGSYKKPIYITENGVADVRDIHRERFIREHLECVSRAMAGGADVRGYFYWSLLDNFEMPRSDGFWPRFGLVGIDYKTLERKIRSSALEYKKIIALNSIDI